MLTHIYPIDTYPKDAYCEHRYWAYVSKGDDDAEKECFCDLNDEICFGKGACKNKAEPSTDCGWK